MDQLNPSPRFRKKKFTPIIGFNSNFEDFNSIKYEFIKELKWFEDEFDVILGSKTENISELDVELAFAILDHLSETINKYRDKRLIFELVTSLNNIERKYHELF